MRSEGDPRDLSHSQIDQIRSYLLDPKGGLFAFCHTIFDYRDLSASVHGPICELMGLWGTPGYERLMVQIPREFFKTSVLSRANPMWQICRKYYAGEDDQVAIFNERLENTTKWIRAIKDVIQSNRIFHILFKLSG